MAREVVWSPEASDDVEAIANYIARDSRFYATAIVTKILDISRKLAEHPFAGRVVPEIGDDSVRERLIYNYRLIYRVRDESITIAAVIHGRRLLDPVANRIERI